MPRKGKWPCGVCFKSCQMDAVFCVKCKKWFHRECECITEIQSMDMGQLPQDFICKNCASFEGHFDFRSSLQRLMTDDKQRQHSGAKMEQILIRHYSLDTPSKCIKYPHSDLLVDSDAYSKLKFYNGKDNGRKPIQVSGDGSCLFNAVSVALCGNESHSMELRTRITIELILHSEEYEQTYPRFKDVCSITESITDGYKGGYSSAFTIAALSTVTQHPTASVYPPLNGLIDDIFGILTTTVHPLRSTTEINETFFVMWTRVGHVDSNRSWFPNHFVSLLVDRSDVHTLSTRGEGGC